MVVLVGPVICVEVSPPKPTAAFYLSVRTWRKTDSRQVFQGCCFLFFLPFFRLARRTLARGAFFGVRLGWGLGVRVCCFLFPLSVFLAVRCSHFFFPHVVVRMRALGSVVEAVSILLMGCLAPGGPFLAAKFPGWMLFCVGWCLGAGRGVAALLWVSWGGKLFYGGRLTGCPRRLYSIGLPHARKARFENRGGFCFARGRGVSKGAVCARFGPCGARAVVW